MKKGLIVVFLILLSPGLNADSKFYTGLWQYQVEVQMTGMPRSNLKRVEDCINDLNDLINLFKPDPACEIRNVKTSNIELGWEVFCQTAGGNYSGTARLSGNNQVINGRLDMQTQIPGVNSAFKTTYFLDGIAKGRCKKSLSD